MILTKKHDPKACFEVGEKRRQITQKLKDMMATIDDFDKRVSTGEWPPNCLVPLITYPLTKEKPASYYIPPDEAEANIKRNTQIVGGRVVRSCACTKRDGLQADCLMKGCRGSALCLAKPYPLCPPGGRAYKRMTQKEVDDLLATMPPVSEPSDKDSCRPGESCSPTCRPCTATFRNLCDFLPEWYGADDVAPDKQNKTKDLPPNMEWWCCVKHK